MSSFAFFYQVILDHILDYGGDREIFDRTFDY